MEEKESFFKALFANDTIKIKNFIEKGFDINETNDEQENALHIACRKGNTQIVYLLLEKKIDINKKNVYGDNALIIACSVDAFSLVEPLIKKGIDINVKNFCGTSALSWLLGEERDEVLCQDAINSIVLLIENGVKPDKNLCFELMECFDDSNKLCYKVGLFSIIRLIEINEDVEETLVYSKDLMNEDLHPLIDFILEKGAKAFLNQFHRLSTLNLYPILEPQEKKNILTTYMFFKRWENTNKIKFPKPIRNLILDMNKKDFSSWSNEFSKKFIDSFQPEEKDNKIYLN